MPLSDLIHSSAYKTRTFRTQISWTEKAFTCDFIFYDIYSSPCLLNANVMYISTIHLTLALDLINQYIWATRTDWRAALSVPTFFLKVLVQLCFCRVVYEVLLWKMFQPDSTQRNWLSYWCIKENLKTNTKSQFHAKQLFCRAILSPIVDRFQMVKYK